jgi:RNA polymerase sigma factor (TIGR02999 family)
LKPGAYIRRERPDHTLQPTALVNEACLRLIKAPQVAWDDRAHFFGIAARVMRQILVDHARKRRAHKRGWPARAAQSVATLADPAGGLEMDLLALHEALDELAVLDPRQAKIVELRYFGGLTEHEVAALARHHPPGDRGGSVLARAPPEGPAMSRIPEIH